MNFWSVCTRVRAALMALSSATPRLRLARAAGGIFLLAAGLAMLGAAAPSLVAPIAGAGTAAIGSGAAGRSDPAGFAALADSRTDNCAGADLLELPKSDICTHGPDPAPPGYDVARRVPALARSVAALAPQVACIGDGVSGPRVQVIYARASDVPNRYDAYLPSFRQWTSDADQIFQASAAETGGSRQIRYVTDGNCVVDVANVTLSPTGDDSFDNTVTELRAKGFSRADRKYMIFVDTTKAGICGIGSVVGDDRPTQDNRNNAGPSYGRIDAGCWGGFTAAHELMHNLGGVQLTAPHTSQGWHCIDEYDVMCYSDGPDYPDMVYLCPNASHENRFDCGHDDYFSTNPPAGSYLATRWNAANNKFLAAGLGDPPPSCPDAKFEPDDTAAQARAFTIGATETHAFCAAVGDEDWIRFDATAGSTYQVETLDLASGVDTVLQIYGSDGSSVVASDDNGGGGRASLIRYLPTTSGRAYVRVHPAAGSAMGAFAAYNLRVTAAKDKPAISLASNSGPVGAAVNVRLTGYPSNQTIALTWDGSRQATAKTDANGAATTSFVAPPATRGAHPIRADAGGVGGSATFTITPSLALSSSSGDAGLSVTVSMNGFKANEKIALKWFEGRKKRVGVGSVKASPNGEATATFTIPRAAKVGDHKVRAVGAAGSSAVATFSVSGAAAGTPAQEDAKPPRTTTGDGADAPDQRQPDKRKHDQPATAKPDGEKRTAPSGRQERSDESGPATGNRAKAPKESNRAGAPSTNGPAKATTAPPH